MEEKEKNYRRWAWIVLCAIGLITAGSIYAISAWMEFDYDFENFFPQDDPDTEFFLNYREAFESDNDFVLVGLRNEEGIFDSTFLDKVHRLTLDLKDVIHVNEVQSPTTTLIAFKSLTGPSIYTDTLLHHDKPQWYEQDSIRLFQDERFLNNMVSPSGKDLSILVKHVQYLDKEGCEELTEELNALLDEYEFDEEHLAGRAVGQVYYVDKMQKDLMFFISASMVLLMVFLIIAFRSQWGVILPMTVVMVSAIWTLGFMAVMGQPINLILTVLPTIMFVVGMSDVVHIVSKYIEELRGGNSKFGALRVSIREVGLATLLTSVTTALGFFTLLSVSQEPVQDFGIYTGIGVMLAYILAFTLLPAALTLMGKPSIAAKRQESTFWTKTLHRSYLWVQRHPWKIMGGTVVTFAISIYLCFQIPVNNFLLEDLSDSDPMKQNFMFFADNFSGARPFEMGIHMKDTSRTLLDREFMEELEKMNSFLKENYELGSIFSLASVMKSANVMWNAGEYEYYHLPEKGKKYDRLKKFVDRKLIQTDSLDFIISDDGNWTRIYGRMGDRGSTTIDSLNEEVEKFYRDSINTDLLDYKITGTAHLIDKNNAYLASSMMMGLMIAFAAIALIMGLLFRSVKVVFLSLLPNVLPLLLIGAVMGLLGTELRVSTSIIFTIAFGIAVDDTIHFMSKLRIELAKGKGYAIALRRTYLSTGRAIVLTSLILCAGFLMLVYSDFLGTYYIGLLISLTLLFAVLADLIFLPALLILFYKPSKRFGKTRKAASD